MPGLNKVLLIGNLGAGKTTLLRILSGLSRPSKGQVLVFGEPVATEGMAMRARVGYMSQSFSLYTELTARQNLELHARLFHIPTEDAHRRIDGLAKACGLTGSMDANASDLPLGLRQGRSLPSNWARRFVTTQSCSGT